MKKYILNVAYAIDVLILALSGMADKQGQTISGKLGSDYPGSLAARFVDWLMPDEDNDHTEDAKEHEINLK